ncbi:MAG: hypothetical protein HLX51_06450 [Micrococcaceae bacterium]|nr:hypothetical protein [Micrococcaceae bacterium]
MKDHQPFHLELSDDSGANTAEYSVEQTRDQLVIVKPRHDRKSSGAWNTVKRTVLSV